MPENEDYDNLLASEGPAWYAQKENGINASLKLDTEVVKAEDGSFVRMTALVTFRGPDWLSGHEPHSYSLFWLMFDCDHAYDYVPRCNMARTDKAGSVIGKTSETVKMFCFFSTLLKS